MRHILQYILKTLSKIIIWKYKPEIVAVTGSVGKTGTKEAIYRVLKKQFRVRRSIGNYNNEIGVPLTILGSDLSPATRFGAIFSWLKIFAKAILTITWSKDYPEILVLELAVAKPGDMEYLLSFVPVKVGIITAIGEFPSHMEFFPEKEDLIKEKSLVVQSLPKRGLAVLNYDDLSVRMIGDELSETKAIYYGFGQGADIKISNYEIRIDDFAKGDYGINFKIEHNGSIVPIKLNKVLGKQKVFAATAAAAVGLHYGLNMVEISSSLIRYRSMPGRSKIISGIKNSWIIDDTYNASPTSTTAALELLEEVSRDHQTGKKIAVLGDMLELGEFMEVGHRKVGEGAAAMADMLFVVGGRARFISDQARKQGYPEDKIFEYYRPEEAAREVQNKIEQGDIILVKGSRGMHMEKVVKEIMARPEKAKKLLVS